MLVYLLAIFCLSLASGKVAKNPHVLRTGSDELSWPDTYYVKASKLSLTSNLMEDFEEWKTENASRIDYNGGVVKSIVVLGDASNETDGYKFEIHPETTDGEETTFKCTGDSEGSFYTLELDSILPPISDEDYFEAVANETIVDKETVKFEYIDYTSEKEVRKYIWAEYLDFGDDDSLWVPVRYEIKKFNSVLGSLLTHEIWDFYDFSIYVDEDVFEVVTEYDCDLTEAKIIDSDKVYKELMFINPDNEKHVDHVFKQYIQNFKREYAHEQEHNMRKTIFQQNMKMVRSHNKKNAGYKMAINQFSDRTPAELERTRGLKMRAPGKTGNIAFPYSAAKLEELTDEIPKEHDLRLLDLVSPVKNQEDCGSCWTFGTTSAVEGAWARKNGGRLLALSNQALVDCVWPFGASGCDGGTDNAAYEWMMEYGLPTEEEYGSYKNRDDVCRIANMSTTFPIKGFTDVTPFSESATKVALYNNGPLSVSVHVTQQFSHYSSGIFYQKDCNPLHLNHEVTMVGYGERDGDLFWIIKNSWGPNWGIDGYMLIAAKDNTCGTITEPTYVVF